MGFSAFSALPPPVFDGFIDLASVWRLAVSVSVKTSRFSSPAEEIQDEAMIKDHVRLGIDNGIMAMPETKVRRKRRNAPPPPSPKYSALTRLGFVVQSLLD